MAEHRHVPEPGEMIYTPRPSWGPVFFAAGAVALLCGIFAGGFAFPPVFYAVVGVILIIGGLTFFPALALGPIVEHLAMNANTLF